MQQIFDALHFHPTTFILMTINILVVMAVLYKLFYKPVGAMLEARKNSINDTLRQAAEANHRARLNELQYTEALSNARYVAKKILNEASDIGESMRQDMLKEAKIKANLILAKANDEIEAERQRAQQDLQDEVSRLAIEAAKKVLGKEIDPKMHQELIQNLLKEAGKL